MEKQVRAFIWRKIYCEENYKWDRKPKNKRFVLLETSDRKILKLKINSMIGIILY